MPRHLYLILVTIIIAIVLNVYVVSKDNRNNTDNVSEDITLEGSTVDDNIAEDNIAEDSTPEDSTAEVASSQEPEEYNEDISNNQLEENTISESDVETSLQDNSEQINENGDDIYQYLSELADGHIEQLISLRNAKVEEAISVLGEPKTQHEGTPESDDTPYLEYDKFCLGYTLNDEGEEVINEINLINLPNMTYEDVINKFGEPDYYDDSGDNLYSEDYFSYEMDGFTAVFKYDHFDEKKQILSIGLE
ncbi:hypothetical protein [Geobacillus sp. TFV-3]|uniref:hypothetical protein n=1 Tax=Geobacillus sp. TFV-3 TaxID=1897059 RepID=UPI001358DD0F|nr:hypothetical protein [Geobacillus sp. TFV-3]KAF0994592.1 hypothetical protein BJQ97_01234 [Geobacillus sp. TFV-3]